MGPNHRGVSRKKEHPRFQSSQRRSRLALRHERERWDALLRVLLDPPADEEALLQQAVEGAVQITDSRFGLLAEIEDGSRVGRRVFSRRALRECAVSPNRLDGSVPHEALWTECLRTHKPIVRNYLDRVPRCPGFPDGHIPLRSVLCAPVLEANRVVAIIMVANKVGRYEASDAEQLVLYLETVWHLLTRRLLERELREQDTMFRALAEQSIVGVGLIGEHGLQYANRTLEALSGYSVAEIKALGPTGFLQAVHPEDRDLVHARHVARMKGTPGVPNTYECRLLRPNGETRWVSVSANRLEVAGSPSIAVFVVDTHERRESDEARQKALKQVRETLNGLVETLSRTVEARDPYTAGHQARVSDLARAIASEMGLDGDRVEAVRMAGLLHDVGKVAIPAEILAKPRALTAVEFAIVREHSRLGYEILKPVHFPWPIHQYVLQHHERMDGSGYPNGLRGDEIELESRILAASDVVEAMSSHRPYRPALGVEKALEFLDAERGKTMDGSVVEACLRLFREKGYRLP